MDTPRNRTVTRHAKRLPALAIGLALSGAALLSPLSAQAQTVEQRLAALETKLACLTKTGTDMVIKGCNLLIQNGLNDTSTKNGLGNLIIGYNEDTIGTPNDRTGSHNLVVGKEHAYSSYGGFVTGLRNTISGSYASVSGGEVNTASAHATSVSGG